MTVIWDLTTVITAMKTKLLFAFVSGLTLVSAAWAADAAKPVARVAITFVSPENFSDVKSDSMATDRDRDYLLDTIKSYMEKRAGLYLATGQSLEIKVTDVDLAGDFEPWRGPGLDHVRILKDIYPPRMELEFRLASADGKTISEGKRRLQNLGYLMTSPLPTNDPLRYDKEMIDDWMRQEFKRS